MVALWIPHREPQAIHYRDVREALGALPIAHVLVALLLTAANYLVLSADDQLGFLYVGNRLAR